MSFDCDREDRSIVRDVDSWRKVGHLYVEDCQWCGDGINAEWPIMWGAYFFHKSCFCRYDFMGRPGNFQERPHCIPLGSLHTMSR